MENLIIFFIENMPYFNVFEVNTFFQLEFVKFFVRKNFKPLFEMELGANSFKKNSFQI